MKGKELKTNIAKLLKQQVDYAYYELFSCIGTNEPNRNRLETGYRHVEILKTIVDGMNEEE